MKKVLGLVLVSVLALSVVACTKKKDEAPVAPDTATAPANPAAPAEAPAQK